MFSDNNEQFLMQFEQGEDNNENIKQVSSGSPIVPPMIGDHKRELSQSSDEKYQETMKSIQIKRHQILTNSKRNEMFSRSRKFSEEKIKKKNWQKAQSGQISGKDDDSSQQQDKKQVGHVDLVQKSVKSKAAPVDRNNVQQIQSSFMRKMRNLETRIKNMDLNYQTLLVKSKKQQNDSLKESNIIKDFLKSKYPQILFQIQQHISTLSQSSISSFGSSSNEKNNDEWTPILSKIQQLRIDGQKMCQMIKKYQISVVKKRQDQEQALKEEQKKNYESELKEKIIRKYSIPMISPRHKKQSFQTTMITETKQLEGKVNSRKKDLRINVDQIGLKIK